MYIAIAQYSYGAAPTADKAIAKCKRGIIWLFVPRHIRSMVIKVYEAEDSAYVNDALKIVAKKYKFSFQCRAYRPRNES